MQTLDKWLEDHPDVRIYQTEYGEDQKGGFGKKGWTAYGGQPWQFYVMGVEWKKDFRGELFPKIIVTIKLFWDEDHPEQ